MKSSEIAAKIQVQQRKWNLMGINPKIPIQDRERHTVTFRGWGGGFDIGRIFQKLTNMVVMQCPRTNLNKRFLPRPKITTAWNLIPHRSKISKNWNPPHWIPLHRFFKNWFLLIQKQLYIYLVKKFLPWRISILADFRPVGYNLPCCCSILSR